MDPIVLAALIGVLGGVIGTLLGGVVEAGRADQRTKEERDFQRERQHLSWEREERLAQETRVQELRQASLDETVRHCLAVLDYARRQEPGLFPTPYLQPRVNYRLLGEISVFRRWMEVAVKAEAGVLPATQSELDELDGVAGAVARVHRHQSERIARNEPLTEIALEDVSAVIDEGQDGGPKRVEGSPAEGTA